MQNNASPLSNGIFHSMNKIDKSENEFGFKCKYTVKDGILKMIDDLMKINFEKNVFRSKKFYRLQYLEDLYEKKLINDNLKWIN